MSSRAGSYRSDYSWCARIEAHRRSLLGPCDGLTKRGQVWELSALICRSSFDPATGWMQQRGKGGSRVEVVVDFAGRDGVQRVLQVEAVVCLLPPRPNLVQTVTIDASA